MALVLLASLVLHLWHVNDDEAHESRAYVSNTKEVQSLVGDIISIDLKRKLPAKDPQPSKGMSSLLTLFKAIEMTFSLLLEAMESQISTIFIVYKIYNKAFNVRQQARSETSPNNLRLFRPVNAALGIDARGGVHIG